MRDVVSTVIQCQFAVWYIYKQKSQSQTDLNGRLSRTRWFSCEWVEEERKKGNRVQDILKREETRFFSRPYLAPLPLRGFSLKRN